MVTDLKKTIKIQTQCIRPIKPDSYKNLPKEFIRKSDGLSKKFSHTIRINVNDISTRKKLAFVIRKHFGFGTFNILFYNKYQKSSNYNPKFRCLLKRKRHCDKKNECNIWKRHKKGWQCKKNRRYRPNWSKRAKITIKLASDIYGGDDFIFIWHKRQDLMHYFSRFFWREKEKR